MNNQTFSIQRLNPTHVPQLVLLEQFSLYPSWTADHFLAEFTNGRGRIYGLLIKDELVGFLVCEVLFEEAHITNFTLSPHYRGKHLGRALLQFVLAELSQEHLALVTLEVRESNFVARNLYLSEGFVEVGKRPNFYLPSFEDALLLTKYFS